MSEASVLLSPNYVRARNLNRLRVLVVEQQARLGVQFNFSALTFIYNPDDKHWYCIFPEKLDVNEL